MPRWIAALLVALLPVLCAPHPAAGGINFWSSVGPVGGPVTVLAIDPTVPTTLYAGDQSVFKSTDGAASWVTVGDGVPALTLVVDPGAPTRRPVREREPARPLLATRLCR